MLLTLACLNLAIWSWLLLGHGRFWLSGPTLTDATPPRRPLRVTVVIPARDEAEHIVETLQSLLAQNTTATLHILLVDDSSTDGTSSLALNLAQSDPRLRVVTAPPLAPGWSGKMAAVAHGLAQPEALAADYVLLTDADITHAPNHLALLTHKAETQKLDLVSEMVRLRCQTFAERATIPAFVFFFQMLYPFRRACNPRCRTAAAAGGTMLVSRAALDRIDGVSRIRTALIDDVALAREIKRGGHAIWLGHADAAVSQRVYPAFADVWNMIARTAYVQINYSPLLLAGTCLGLLLVYLEPVLAALLATGPTRILGLICWLLMAIAFQPTLRRYRTSPLWGLALPAIALFYLAATIGSAVRFYQGRGGQWKNRHYPAQN